MLRQIGCEAMLHRNKVKLPLPLGRVAPILSVAHFGVPSILSFQRILSV
ncbi:MAG: hypothetical protein M3P30_04325 [Chloroflexota bacterium]|nr:hypothetical protein [Chloroflexota bacterium]